jgi:hypothetical protein
MRELDSAGKAMASCHFEESEKGDCQGLSKEQRLRWAASEGERKLGMNPGVSSARHGWCRRGIILRTAASGLNVKTAGAWPGLAMGWLKWMEKRPGNPKEWCTSYEERWYQRQGVSSPAIPWYRVRIDDRKPRRNSKAGENGHRTRKSKCCDRCDKFWAAQDEVRKELYWEWKREITLLWVPAGESQKAADSWSYGTRVSR